MKRIYLFPIFVVLFTIVFAGCSSSPSPAEFTIEMTEFAYTPETIEVQVGQKVVLHLANEGALAHEWMIGQNVMMMEGTPNGFEHNMFEKQGPEVMGGSDEHDMGSMGGMDHGYMVAMPIGEKDITLTFTVTEDMVGEWEIGCFSDGGSHYTQGMKGKFVVNP